MTPRSNSSSAAASRPLLALPKGMPRRLLIANRGEIALRVARTARRLGLETLGIFSTADAGLPHLRLCHRARELSGEPRKVYLDIGLILDAAKKLNADAIHPGYGFLSENKEFAAAVEKAGMRFVGPTAGQIEKLGDKLAARKAAQKLGLPTVPGTLHPIPALEEATQTVKELGLPVIIKAAAGGGGRGMRVVENAAQLPDALARAQGEAQAAFGDGRVFIEKYFPSVRHVEIQILGDGKGHAVSLGERECSVQRRHQKLIEESPTTALPESVTRKMGDWASKLVAGLNYRGAGTLEFLVPSGSQEFYFIEMNTRLQVEHTITEMRTGLDLVEEQLRIAGGGGFSFDPKKLEWRGHAIEARIQAEDPEEDFRPSLGRMDTVMLPAGPGIRVDGWAETGLEVSPHYDSLLAKVIAWGRTREEAIGRLTQALQETICAPVATTAPFCAEIINGQPFRDGLYDTSLVAQVAGGGRGSLSADRKAAQRKANPASFSMETAVLAAATERFQRNRTDGLALGQPGRSLSAWQLAEQRPADQEK